MSTSDELVGDAMSAFVKSVEYPQKRPLCKYHRGLEVPGPISSHSAPSNYCCSLELGGGIHWSFQTTDFSDPDFVFGNIKGLTVYSKRKVIRTGRAYESLYGHTISDGVEFLSLWKSIFSEVVRSKIKGESLLRALYDGRELTVLTREVGSIEEACKDFRDAFMISFARFSNNIKAETAAGARPETDKIKAKSVCKACKFPKRSNTAYGLLFATRTAPHKMCLDVFDGDWIKNTQNVFSK